MLSLEGQALVKTNPLLAWDRAQVSTSLGLKQGTHTKADEEVFHEDMGDLDTQEGDIIPGSL